MVVAVRRLRAQGNASGAVGGVLVFLLFGGLMAFVIASEIQIQRKVEALSPEQVKQVTYDGKQLKPDRLPAFVAAFRGLRRVSRHVQSQGRLEVELNDGTTYELRVMFEGSDAIVHGFTMNGTNSASSAALYQILRDSANWERS